MKVEIVGYMDRYVSPGDMGIGELGVVRRSQSAGDYAGEVVLRTYDGLVSLSKPTNTWAFPQGRTGPSLEIEKLPPGVVVRLHT